MREVGATTTAAGVTLKVVEVSNNVVGETKL